MLQLLYHQFGVQSFNNLRRKHFFLRAFVNKIKNKILKMIFRIEKSEIFKNVIVKKKMFFFVL